MTVHHDRVRILVGEPVDRGLARWEEPLSRIQNTRSADVYGSCSMTWATSRQNGSMPVLSSQRPNTCPRCTSYESVRPYSHLWRRYR